MNAIQKRPKFTLKDRKEKPARMKLVQQGWTEYVIGFDTHKKWYRENQCHFDLAKLTKKERLGMQRWCLELLQKMNRLEG